MYIYLSMAVTRRSPLPPSAGTTEASSITRRSSTSELGYIARGGVAPFNWSSRTQVRTHARTHAGWWWWCWWSPRFLPRPPARRVCDVGLTEERAHGENGNGAPRHRARRIARTHASTSERACCCGCGMWVVVRCAFGRTRAAARDARDARAACNVSARAGTARGVVVCLLLGPLRWARRARAVLSPSYPRFSRVPRNAGVKITGAQPT